MKPNKHDFVSVQLNVMNVVNYTLHAGNTYLEQLPREDARTTACMKTMHAQDDRYAV